MSKDITSKSIEEINLTEEEIKKIIKDIQINKFEQLKIGNYRVCTDYYIDLYKLRIKLGYSINKCSKYLNTDYATLYNRLRKLNWENKNIQISDDDIYIKLKNISLNKEEIKDIKDKIKKYNLTKWMQKRSKRNYSSVLELYKDIYKMRFKLCYPLIVMEEYLYGDDAVATIRLRLKKIGWEYTMEESQQLASQYIRNYNEIRLTAKRTALNNYIEIEGSSEEKYIREKFNIELTSSLPDLEVIVGANNLSILDGEEIDIPIIIIDNTLICKFCIEVNGDRWHNESNRKITDNKKKEKALLKNYNLFTIWLGANSKIQREKYGSIDKQIQDIISEIKSRIQKIIC